MAFNLRYSLQDWYVRLNSIYVDRNFYRTPESIFCHLVEVSRGLSIAASRKRKRDLNAEDFLPKTMAWWFAMCGRVGIPSVEEMLWAKYPGVCPYCRLPTHVAAECKEKKGDKREISWTDLSSIGSSTSTRRPVTLTDWQSMFQKIYPRGDTTDHELNITRLSEELGELSEAVRVLPVAPQYFVSEAPDVFAWLMGFANQFAFDRNGPGDTLEEAMERQYPGLCTTCGYSVCKCPPIPASTLGRIAKEAPVGIIFHSHPGLFNSSEAIKLFTEVEKAIVIGDRAVPAGRADVEELAEDIRSILTTLKEHGEKQSLVSIQVAASLGKLEALAAQGAVTQEAVEGLIGQIRALPSENRSALVNFLTSLAASGLFQSILQASTLLMK